jgi:ABC-type dipeptide/oligopeptide/nickel transport system permease component
MLNYIRLRLVLAVPTIILVTILVFLMLYAIPGDPASIFAGDKPVTPELLAQIREDMGLNRPLYVQYGDFLWRALHGDLGRSLQSRRPVMDAIMLALPNTLELAVAAMLFAIALGVSMGVISALKHNTWLDTLSMLTSLVGISMPIFWLSLLLILVFAVNLRWFPSIGEGGVDRLVLPAAALGLISAAPTARLIRSSMLEVLQQEYVNTARAKGLHQTTIIARHVLKNAFIPALTVMGMEFGNLLGGAVITETVFARLGLGRLYVEGILTKDFPMVQGLTLLIAVIYVMMNLLVDVLYAYFDPRIRYE